MREGQGAPRGTGEQWGSRPAKALVPALCRGMQCPSCTGILAGAVSCQGTESRPMPYAMLFSPAESFSHLPFLQLVSALHSLTRHVVYRGLTRAEDILALFPENFHQNLKNLLTKIILENM